MALKQTISRVLGSPLAKAGVIFSQVDGLKLALNSVTRLE